MKTVKPRTTISLIASILLMAGCASQPEINVSTDYSMANFDQFRSYQWLPEDKGEGRRVENELIGNRITTSIDETLISKGYHQTEMTPDIYVHYSVTTANKVDVDNNQTYEGYAPGFTWRRGYGAQAKQAKIEVMETSIVQYTEGSLMVDIIDPKNMQIIWRGIGTKKLPEYFDHDITDRVVNNIVAATLENYPPPME